MKTFVIVVTIIVGLYGFPKAFHLLVDREKPQQPMTKEVGQYLKITDAAIAAHNLSLKEATKERQSFERHREIAEGQASLIAGGLVVVGVLLSNAIAKQRKHSDL